MLGGLRARVQRPASNVSAAVEIYTWRTCPFCIRAKMLLRKKGVAYTEHRVGKHDESRRRMAERANGHWTVPEIFIEGTHIGGCEELYDLERNGRLDPLLTRSARD